MDPTLAAAFASWSFDAWAVLALVAVALLYLRGFRSLRRRHPERFPRWRAGALLLGLSVFLIAIASPIDAFADLLLQVHMAQHLLLMMVAPPLIWLGAPINPLLQGLPRGFLKQGLGPFLAWPALQRLGTWLVHPITAWLAFVGTTWVWHAPRLYEAALRSPLWHEVEHLCFFSAALLFWFPVLQPWPSRAAWPRAAMLPYLVLAGLQMTAFSALFSFSGRLFYPIYADMPRLWGVSALEDQAAAGAVMWVPSSVVLLIAIVWLVVTLLESPLPPRATPTLVRRSSVPRSAAPLDLLRLRVVGPLLGSLTFRRMAQTVLFGLALAIVLDGLLGPSAASHNLAGVLPWTYARAFAVLGLLVAGNLFCYACPFTLPRSLARRLLGGGREAPRWLRTKWTAVTLFLLFLVGYEAFDLWDSPWWTAWIVVGYFTTAFTIDGLYGGASFCRGVCPIGQFQFVGSTISPLEVRMRDPAVCASCLTHDCLRGGPKGPGCDLDLFQPTKIGNLDCTFCLDCTRACPHDNVGVGARLPGSGLVSNARRAAIGRLTRRRDLAAFALVFSFGAFANAAAMVAPVSAWERAFGRQLGLDSERVSVALLLLLAVVGAPWLSTALAGLLGRVLSRLRLARGERRDVTRHLAFSLLPLGFAMWLAHFSFHLATAGGSLSLAVGRVFGWLHLPAHAMSAPPLIAADALLPWEITTLGVGLWVTLFVAWRIAFDTARLWRPALGLFAPWAILASALWVAGLWILFQPMEMRGMAMG